MLNFWHLELSEFIFFYFEGLENEDVTVANTGMADHVRALVKDAIVERGYKDRKHIRILGI